MGINQQISATSIELLDHSLLLKINGLHHPIADWVMAGCSHPLFWIWLYLIILFAAYKKGNWQGLAFIVIGILITFAITDLTSVHGFKNVFERYRPCHNLALQSLVRLPFGHCGGQYGFVSSHAANTGGLMAFVWASSYFKHGFGRTNQRILYGLLIFYFVSNCYSRMYLGVHFPSDILVGGTLGIAAGIFTAWLLGRVPYFKMLYNKQ